jgi:hypothetical protein
VKLIRLLFSLSLVSLSLAAPLLGQFAITVQQNGQAFSVANGGSIAFNAPAVTQSASATVTVTYLGAGMAVFALPAKLTGSSSFSGVPGPASLNQGQSANFSVNYTASDSLQTVAQFLWAYIEVSTTGLNVGTQIGSGGISFNLVGTAPNVVVGQITTDSSFVAVPSGGTFSFTNTAVNLSSSVTIAISNSGSGSATISAISATGSDFKLQGVPLLPATLGAGTQLNVAAVFTPASPGAKTGGVKIVFGSSTYTAVLSGTAVASFLSYQITQDGTTAPLTPNQTITFDDTKVGSKSSVVVQIQNTAPFAGVLNSIGLSGSGYSITDAPFFPITLQPQQIISITATYSPLQPESSTGRLLIGNDNFQLAARGLGSKLLYSYQAGGSTIPVNPADTVSFSPLAVGQNESVPFTVTNTGNVATSIVSIGIVGSRDVFQLANLPTLPLQLDPGASASFSMNFSPQASGQSTATLLVNNQSFALSGFSTVPPALPSYHFTGASGVQQPFQQPSLGLSLDATYPIAITGVLTLTIASSSFASDPAVQFSSGGRQVLFTIPANTLQATFPNGATQIRIQTGTVAGTINIAPTFIAGSTNGTDITPSSPAKLQLTVPSLAPTLLTASLGSRTATSFSIIVTGFSTTRVMNSLTFVFSPSTGSSVQTVTTKVDIAAAAGVWFQSATSQNLGGQFTVEIPFTLGTGSSIPVGTDLTKSISGVTVTGANDIGSSNTLQVALP